MNEETIKTAAFDVMYDAIDNWGVNAEANFVLYCEGVMTMALELVDRLPTTPKVDYSDLE